MQLKYEKDCHLIDNLTNTKVKIKVAELALRSKYRQDFL
jgi:hypothetical protein